MRLLKKETFEGKKVRLYTDGKNLWIPRTDLSNVMGYTHPDSICKQHNRYKLALNPFTKKAKIPDKNGVKRKITMYSLGGIYLLVYHCTLPGANRFYKYYFKEYLKFLDSFYNEIQKVS
ncbi:MAG: Bro-N domain-containing protein [archaeon]